MGTKLYVANLPNAPSALALRAHFSTCGSVSEVELVPERNSGRGRGSAFIRMGSAAAAERAVSELNGAPFAGQLLIVEAAPDDAVDRRSAAKRREERTDDAGSGARITLQYREPTNMTYELDCSGVTLVVRLFFPGSTEQWRIVVQASRDADAPITAAVAASRLEAFRDVVRACREGVGFADLGRVDWNGVEQALLKVRAL